MLIIHFQTYYIMVNIFLFLTMNNFVIIQMTHILKKKYHSNAFLYCLLQRSPISYFKSQSFGKCNQFTYISYIIIYT